MIKADNYSGAELAKFRHYQALSYEILVDTAQALRPGISEHQAARQMRKAFGKAGVKNYFHVPVALFGERSAYPGDFGPFEALPTDRVLIESVLGHRVTKADTQRLAGWSYRGLAVKQVSWFLFRSRLSRGRFRNMTPNWNHTKACKDVAPHGLWAVEPHVALEGVGVKFEEILLIDADGARWLDDDLPHHRRWHENSFVAA